MKFWKLQTALRRLASVLMLFAAFSSLGGAWMVLQGVAWSTMLVNYSQSSGIAPGIRKTFDGKHPCGMCHEISSRHEKHSQQNVVQFEFKFQVYSLPVCTHSLVQFYLVERRVIEPLFVGQLFGRRPDVPPPRLSA